MNETKKELLWGSVTLKQGVVFKGDGKNTPSEVRGERLKIEITSPPRSIDGFIDSSGGIFVVAQMLDLSDKLEHGFKLTKASEEDAGIIRNARKQFTV